MRIMSFSIVLVLYNCWGRARSCIFFVAVFGDCKEIEVEA